MISYKQWKLLRENLDGAIGLSTPRSLGVTGSIYGESPMMGMMKKKPGMGGPGDDAPPPDDEHGDEEDDDLDDDHLGDDDKGDDDDTDDDAEGDEEGGDEEGGDEDGDMGPDAGAMGGADAAMGGMGGPPMKKKPPMPPPQMMKSFMKKEHEDDDEEDMDMKKKDDDDDMDMEKPSCCSKCGSMANKKSKKCCKNAKKMTKENQQFLNALKNQTGAIKFQKDEFGYWVPMEDVLITPEQPADPQPGEAGFAPQQKLGLGGSNFQEWSNKHKSKVKKKK
jgi:hypothetical protein